MESIYDQVINFDENEESDFIMSIPYLMEEFKTWLIETRGLKEKSAEDYIRAYESAYEPLYELVEIDLYGLLRAFLTEIPEDTGNDLTKDVAPELVNVYLETMQEELAKHEDSYTKANLLAMMAYHDFIVCVAESSDEKLLKPKAAPLPDEEEFLSWLETEYNMDYENARKIISSVKRMDLILPSLVSEPMTFLDVLRAIYDKSKRKNYIEMVSNRKERIFAKAKCSLKTIQNGLSNISNYYLNFLNSNTCVH